MKYLRHVSIILMSILSAAQAAYAGGPDIHIRGEVVSVSDSTLIIKAENGQQTTLQVPEKFDVLDVSKSAPDAVKSNSYVGVVSKEAKGGKRVASGILIFPEGARGLNEGHFPWDLGTGSTMTNATVQEISKKSKETQIELQYGKDMQDVVVNKSTLYGAFIPGTREIVKPGAKVVAFAKPQDSGGAVLNIIMVGRNGFLPPI